MDYENMSQIDKCAILEHAVLTKSPEEISRLYRQLGQVQSSARALGLACRFRGLSYVRALVESGANFIYVRPERAWSCEVLYYWLAPLEMSDVLCCTDIDARDACFNKFDGLTPLTVKEVLLPNWASPSERDAYKADVVTDGEMICSVLPAEQRAEIVEYLYKHREKVCLDVEELLFFAIMSSSSQITRVLKAYGVCFSEQRITALTEDGFSKEWWQFCQMLGHLGDEEYLEVVDSIAKEIKGNKLNYTNAVYLANCDRYHKQCRMFRPDFFRFTLEHFNQKKMNKTKLMKGAIDQDSVACLEICAEYGWLQMPRRRDEMIQYASDRDKTECAAWLLEFKNRTADFAAEREKAEKKMMRALNANPNSVTELKKTWGFEKREDGAIIITRYKGTYTEVDVPEKIGDSIVAAIGSRAFSPSALRLRPEQDQTRRFITRIALPDTIETIGDRAFDYCVSLMEINIPDRVSAIGMRAFDVCESLSSVKIPSGISEISVEMFANCRSLQSVTIPGNVEVIRKRAFQGCTALETVVIAEGVAEIEALVFADCTNLKSIELPKSVRKIKNYTRKGQSLQTIFDPWADVTAVVTPGSYAERYCKRNSIRYVYKEG